MLGFSNDWLARLARRPATLQLQPAGNFLQARSVIYPELNSKDFLIPNSQTTKARRKSFRPS
jgi:hypothetical protein